MADRTDRSSNLNAAHRDPNQLGLLWTDGPAFDGSQAVFEIAAPTHLGPAFSLHPPRSRIDQ